MLMFYDSKTARLDGSPEQNLSKLQGWLAALLFDLELQKILPQAYLEQGLDLIAEIGRQARALRRKTHGGFTAQDLLDQYGTERN